MAFVLKPGVITLFAQNFKKRKMSAPAVLGSAAVRCPCCNTVIECDVAMWIKETDTGYKFYSGVINPSTDESKAKRAADLKKRAERKAFKLMKDTYKDK